MLMLAVAISGNASVRVTGSPSALMKMHTLVQELLWINMETFHELENMIESRILLRV